MNNSTDGKLLIGVSGCLLGENVRFDGGHKRDRYLTTELSHVFDYVSFCPEVSAGLGVPRRTLRLVSDPQGPKVMEPATETDRTALLQSTSRNLATKAASAGLDGFVLKSNSPTCGMSRVRVYAVDAVTGQERWTYDPLVPRAKGRNACCDVVNRGVALWRGRVYVGTIDGRLIALDAETGELAWEVMTVDPTRPYTITGAPRVVRASVSCGRARRSANSRPPRSATPRPSCATHSRSSPSMNASCVGTPRSSRSTRFVAPPATTASASVCPSRSPKACGTRRQ